MYVRLISLFEVPGWTLYVPEFGTASVTLLILKTCV
jgi:hypothetical protein